MISLVLIPKALKGAIVISTSDILNMKQQLPKLVRVFLNGELCVIPEYGDRVSMHIILTRNAQ